LKPALLVGRNVTTQAPSNNTNNNNSKTQRHKKFATFNMKEQKIKFFYNLITKKEEHEMYVDGGRAMIAMNI